MFTALETMSRLIHRRSLPGLYGLGPFGFLKSAQRRSKQAPRLSSSLPSVVQISFWKSLIPKPLRSTSKKAEKPAKAKEWNPATFFIVIFLLIGSMSIQMIALRQDFATYMRRSDVRIGLLREVVEKIQKGEKVDVEQVLGTGDGEKEKEWEEGMRRSAALLLVNEADRSWQSLRKLSETMPCGIRKCKRRQR
jgi:hypothetical protein